MADQVPLFEFFWFWLSKSKIIGLFPCKKVIKEDGQVQLVPRSGIIHWLSHITFHAIVMAFYTICIYVVMRRADLSLGELYYIVSGQENSVADILDRSIEMITTFFVFTGSSIMAIELFLKRKDLCTLYQVVVQNYRHNEKQKILIGRNGKITIMILIFVNWTLAFLFAFTIGKIFATYLNLDLINKVLIGVSSFLFMSVIYLAQFTFFITFGEYIQTLAIWIVALKEDFNNNGYELLQNANQLAKALKMLSELFSRCNFAGMLIWMVNLILITYRINSFFIKIGGFDSEDLLMVFSYGFMALQHGIVIQFLNLASQTMVDLTNDLKMAVKHTNMKVTNIVWNDKFESSVFAKDIVLDNLEDFQGFEAQGYFTLGKSFLSSIVSIFLTYVIILMQLKLTLITSFK